MSVEVTKYVKIAVASLTEPLEITTDAAIELRDALIEAFPLPPGPVSSRLPPGKWVLKGKTWRKGSRTISTKAVGKLLNHIGKEWKFIGDICSIVGYSENTVRDAVSVLVQEKKMDSQGRGKTRAARMKTIEYVPSEEEVPKIEVVSETPDLSVLKREEILKREHRRQG